MAVMRAIVHLERSVAERYVRELLQTSGLTAHNDEIVGLDARPRALFSTSRSKHETARVAITAHAYRLGDEQADFVPWFADQDVTHVNIETQSLDQLTFPTRAIELMFAMRDRLLKHSGPRATKKALCPVKAVTSPQGGFQDGQAKSAWMSLAQIYEEAAKHAK